MSEIIETTNHPYWGQIQRREGYEEWEMVLEAQWQEKGIIQIRVYFADPDDLVVQGNYANLRVEWTSLWPRIVARTEAMKAEYGFQDTPIDFADDYVSVTLPKVPIDENPAWSVMLQAEEAGWLLDFKGWEDFGGQGVF